jgi:hypothetical protein
MQHHLTKLAIGLTLASALPTTVHAALYDRGGGLIYDSDLNVTWLDVATPLMTWSNAVNWATNLSVFDSVRNVTWTGWRLPAMANPSAGCDVNASNLGGTNCGYNVDPTSSEMAHLFFTELGNKSYVSPTGVIQAGFGLVNTGPFLHALAPNMTTPNFWMGTTYASSPTFAWQFNTYDGTQGFADKTNSFHALAVRPGDVAAVPEADTWAMLLAGLTLVGVAVRRRGQSDT